MSNLITDAQAQRIRAAFLIVLGIMVGVMTVVMFTLIHISDKEYNQPGIVAYKSGHYEEAIVKLQADIKAFPNSGNPAWYYLGRAYLKVHQYQKAVDALTTSDYLNAHYYLGVALYKVSRKSDARDEFQKTILLESGDRFHHPFSNASENWIKRIDSESSSK